MAESTPNLGLPYPESNDELPDYPAQAAEFAGLLDTATRLAQGTFASRPAPSAAPFVYYLATDLPGYLYLSTGSAWIEIAPGAGAVPIGGITDYAGAGDPADVRYLLCDGRAISRTTYAPLFALVSTTWGAGNGSTTFNIPDLRGRASVGPDNMGTGQGAAGRLATTARTLGGAGGTEAHSHSVSIANHGHTVNDHAHGAGNNLWIPDHQHSAGGLYAGNHAHGIGYDGDHAHGVTDATGSSAFTGNNGGSTGQRFTAVNHQHGIFAAGGHSHGGATGGSGNVGIGGATAGSGQFRVTGNTAGVTATVSTSQAGAQTVSSTSVGNAAPYAVVNRIIRIA